METKHYKENKDVTVTWTPSKCIHAGVCVKMLPSVYHPREKPWMLPQNASKEALIDQINKCPSGALGYIVNEENE